MRKKKKSHVQFRLNMLFFIVFLLFSSLIFKLGLVQIVYGEDYKKEVERTENVTVSNPVPRGKIFDRNGNVIVDNVPKNAITYTRHQGTSQEEILKISRKLAKIIEKKTDKVTERDLKDYWILTRPKKAEAKITKKEWELYKQKKITDDELYKLTLKRITEEDLKEISDEELEVVAIKRELDSGYAMTPQIVKNNEVTPKEYAIVSENLEKLPGVNTTTDWDRHYVFGDMLRSILGNISTAEEGLPKEELEYFLVRDYNRNDRVGKSYLEYQYESVLHGQKAKIKNITDRSGNILETQIISEGERGKDLILTIDMELQQAVEKIIEEELLEAKRKRGTQLLDRAFVVMMNPKTGEILSLAGKKLERNELGRLEIKDYALGTFTSSYAMGSAVKGATVLTGFQTGVIKPGTVLRDEMLYLKGTKPKGSYQTMGSINDLTALQRSSNVYMFKTALRLMGTEYRPYMSLPRKPQAFDTFRYYFSQFGLGVKTGIDLPNEATGYQGKDTKPGLLLDLAIGQYDTYTPLQMAQYVSTIANGGYRIKPQIVKEIRQPSMDDEKLGPLVKGFEPVVLNRVGMNPYYIERVQEGFRRVMQMKGGTAYAYFGGKSYKPAGKTGTAESFYYDNEKKKLYSTYNLTLVGYAPHDNPEVAFSVVVPWINDSNNPVNKYIGQRILDKYFELKEKRNSNQSDTDQPNEEQNEQTSE
jgi:penicillin-binding protein A